MKPLEYATELNSQLTYLFEFARSINELDCTDALFNEFRGMQNAGWSTTLTAYQVFDETQFFLANGSALSVPDYRLMLCLYAQLSEAGGVYVGLLNLFGVVELKPWILGLFRTWFVYIPKHEALSDRMPTRCFGVSLVRLR